MNEAAAKISASQELMKSQSIQKEALVDEVDNLKHQLSENYKRLETLWMGIYVSSNKDNLEEDDSKGDDTSAAANDAATRDEKPRKESTF